MSPTDRTQRGFTLIEIIVTLVVASAFASMLYVYMVDITRSNPPILQTQAIFKLQQSMEKLIADYNAGTALATLRTNVNSQVYGAYTVSINNCIDLSSGTEAALGSCTAPTTLKIAIKDNATGATLTALFEY